MVRVINFYYNNRTVQAVQELKNKPSKLLLVVKPLFVLLYKSRIEQNVCE